MRRLSKLALVLMFVGAGCTALRPIAAPGPRVREKLQLAVRPGDLVRVTMSDGRKLRLMVISVGKDELEGRREFTEERHVIPFEQMTTVETRQFAGNRTALLVGSVLVVVVALGIWGALSYEGLGEGWPGFTSQAQ